MSAQGTKSDHDNYLRGKNSPILIEGQAKKVVTVTVYHFTFKVRLPALKNSDNFSEAQSNSLNVYDNQPIKQPSSQNGSSRDFSFFAKLLPQLIILLAWKGYFVLNVTGFNQRRKFMTSR